MNPLDLTLIELRDAIHQRQVSAHDAVRASLDRIDAHDGALRSFLETFPDRALAAAKETDRRLAAGERVGPLAGVPVALKDNMCLNYGRTTCGSRFLEHYESPFTGTAVQKLLDAGAIPVGKTNLDEFAMGSSCEHSAFGPTFNPWDPTRVPGGSSGGSASCVAARMVSASLGSDTGGSIRQPASLTGLVGVKPTYGRVSRSGLVAFASSLDQIGPFTRTVADAALMLNTICGHDPLDSTSAAIDTPDFLHDLDRPIDGLRLGVPRQARSDRNHPAVAAAFEDAVETYRERGATIVDIDLPHLDYGIAAYYIVAPAEASSNLARFDGIRYGRRATITKDESLETLYARSRAEGFGPEVQRRIMLGTHVLSSGYYDAYYLTALKTRRLIKRDFDNAFSCEPGNPGAHAIIMPSAPGPAFTIGEKTGDPLALYLEDIYTVTANLAGVPGVSIPMGFAEKAGSKGENLPVGLQILCPPLEESRMLRVARMYEDATEWHTHAPAMLAR
ncbi:MAG: Asp-tRNA(Asn)/Glu-tRNA(Gln) amidotransferase subunit GatA [Phycisphaeraceae bacterium]|nr:Asp-tRNA(Asn)/Glu-tRNA(Gln) amidotransferase subunit GatA [Phycisphaeraceae bacterium]